MPREELPVLQFESPAAWRQWLDAQHAASEGVWLKIAKKASGITTVTHAAALEEALCYGWIDGQLWRWRRGLRETTSRPAPYAGCRPAARRSSPRDYAR